MNTVRAVLSLLVALVRGIDWRQPRPWILVSALLCAALGGWGFYSAPSATCASQGHWFVAVLQALQLFVLNVSADTVVACGSLTQAAALAAPAVTAVVVTVWLFAPMLKRQWLLAQLPTWQADDIFIGAGDQTRAILAQWAEVAQDKHGASRRVVLVDRDAHASAWQWAQTHRGALDIRWVNSDGADASQLARIGVGNPDARLWLMTHSDISNFEVLQGVLACRKRPAAPSKPVIVSVRNDAHAMSERQLYKNKGLQGRSDIRWVNLSRLVAFKVLAEHPPTLGNALAARRPLNLCVIGTSAWAPALITLMTHHCLIDDDDTAVPSITLFAPNARAVVQQIFQRHPWLDPALDPARAPRDAVWPAQLAKLRAVDCELSALPLPAWQAARAAGFDGIYILEDSCIESRTALTRVLALRDADHPFATQSEPPPIVVALNDHAAKDPRHANPVWNDHGVNIVDVYASCFALGEDHPLAEVDRWVAEHIHAPVEAISNNPPSTAGEPPPWEKELTDYNQAHFEYQWSSRYSYLHQALMAQAQQWREQHPDLTVPSPDRAKTEHRRFVAERLIENWLLVQAAVTGRNAPSGLEYKAQKDQLHLNQTLVPFERLQKRDQSKDDVIVTALDPPPSAAATP